VTLYSLKETESSRGEFTLSISDCLLESGRIYSVIGPNGSGKTTLLNTLAFLQTPSRGRLVFKQKTVDYSDRAAVLALRRQAGYLMQNPYLFNMSVFDNIAYGLKVRACPRDEVRRRVEAIMDRMSLSHLAKRNAHRLSGGEAQRVALARTLVLDCDVVLLDEPTASVDLHNIRAVEEAILQFNREKNTTVIFTTHSHDQAYRMSGSLLSIINGKICGVTYENVFDGTVQEGSDGVRTVTPASGIRFAVGTGATGQKVTIAIDPEDIILSEDRLSSSALNTFQGTITRAEETDGTLRLFVDIGVTLCAVLTRKSFVNMGLNIGKTVWITFKANAVKVL
jgi:tungstate transport system ATP-binding protein